MSDKKLENEIFEQRHSAEKCYKGDRLLFLTSIVLQNIETNEVETLWWNPKNFKKIRIVPKKSNEKYRGEGVTYVYEVLDVDVFVLDKFLAFRVCFGGSS